MGFSFDDCKMDKTIPIPLYYQLKQAILNQITNNDLEVGDLLPTELEFGDVLSISRSTVRQALNELVNEGYLNRVKGKGTTVSKPKINDDFFQTLDSFNTEMQRKGLTPSTQVLSFKVIPGIKNINKHLDIPPQEKLYYLSRLRFANDEPVVYLETYLPYEQYADLLEEDFNKQSLYALLEQKYNKRLTKAERKIQAVNANAQEAKLLQIERNAAVCLVKSIAYISAGTPVEYSIARYRGDRSEFRVELRRN